MATPSDADTFSDRRLAAYSIRGVDFLDQQSRVIVRVDGLPTAFRQQRGAPSGRAQILQDRESKSQIATSGRNGQCLGLITR
jgi:hypothetical protein